MLWRAVGWLLCVCVCIKRQKGKHGHMPSAISVRNRPVTTKVYLLIFPNVSPEPAKMIVVILGLVGPILCVIWVKSVLELGLPDRENYSWPTQSMVRRCATDPNRRGCLQFDCRPRNEVKSRQSQPL